MTDAHSSGHGGTLYLVATPIGNLEDITQRALRTLREVSLVAAEDTRHTRRLLDPFGIRASLMSLFEHNERAKASGFAGLHREHAQPPGCPWRTGPPPRTR